MGNAAWECPACACGGDITCAKKIYSGQMRKALQRGGIQFPENASLAKALRNCCAVEEDLAPLKNWASAKRRRRLQPAHVSNQEDYAAEFLCKQKPRRREGAAFTEQSIYISSSIFFTARKSASTSSNDVAWPTLARTTPRSRVPRKRCAPGAQCSPPRTAMPSRSR